VATRRLCDLAEACARFLASAKPRVPKSPAVPRTTLSPIASPSAWMTIETEALE